MQDPVLAARYGVDAFPEVGVHRVVGHVGNHPRLLAVLSFVPDVRGRASPIFETLFWRELAGQAIK